jgi:N,N'-diacetyllegionaminate synthase
MKVISVGNRLIGDGQPCFLVAEVGINHNGDMQMAHCCIDAAAEAGADGVKFQNYRTEDFISDRSLTYEYISQGNNVVESQYDMFKRCEMPPSVLAELREHCDQVGVAFFATPTSDEGIQDLVNAGSALLKNGSDYLGHLPLIRSMARTGLPTVLSTGMATLSEIDDAVRAFREAGGKQLILLQCTSSYPTPLGEVHLNKLPVLAAAFGCPAGLSEHTVGIATAIGAVVMGACMIEKHFTLSKSLPGPDHRFSADPAEFGALVDGVRTVEKNLGSSAIAPAASEMAGRERARLSCVAAHDLPAGHTLSESDLAFRRPGHGLPPKAATMIIGGRLKQRKVAGEKLDFTDIQ